MRRVFVVGGGITGLAAAYRLSLAGCDVTLLEASARCGGTLRTVNRDGFLLESGPDCFISEKPRGVELCRELGLESELVGTRSENRRSFIVKGGQLLPIPEGFYLIGPSKLRPFLASPLISWPAKWRALAEPLIRAHPATDESLASFVRRRLGVEVLRWLAQPLLAGIFAADPETLSLKATFPQFLEMEEKEGSVLVGLKKRGHGVERASGARYQLFVALQTGMQRLADRLVERIGAQRIRTNAAVRRLTRRNAGSGSWQIEFDNGECLEGDAVCLALPAPACASLLQELDRDLAEALRTIPYSNSATINFAFKLDQIRHPMDGFGFVVPHAEKRATLACTFVHQKFAGRVPAGYALLRAFVGGALHPQITDLDDRALSTRVFEDLKAWLGISGAPLFTTIDRWPDAMPQYTVGHVRRILDLEERLLRFRGLQLAGNWLRGVGIPDCIASGERAAEQLMQYLEPASFELRHKSEAR
jgi:oxygen-dependent protoporphyrinogen oxidase